MFGKEGAVEDRDVRRTTVQTGIEQRSIGAGSTGGTKPNHPEKPTSSGGTGKPPAKSQGDDSKKQ